MKKGIGQGIQLGLYALILTCTSCSELNAEPPASETPKSGELSQQSQENDVNGSSISEGLDQQVSGAVADLAAREGIPADNITVKEARMVHWRSGALGCPREGMAYTQAIVPGILVILEANGSIYHYHGRSEGELFYCPKERVQPPAYGSGQTFM